MDFFKWIWIYFDFVYFTVKKKQKNKCSSKKYQVTVRTVYLLPTQAASKEIQMQIAVCKLSGLWKGAGQAKCVRTEPGDLTVLNRLFFFSISWTRELGVIGIRFDNCATRHHLWFFTKYDSVATSDAAWVQGLGFLMIIPASFLLRMNGHYTLCECPNYKLIWRRYTR